MANLLVVSVRCQCCSHANDFDFRFCQRCSYKRKAVTPCESTCLDRRTLQAVDERLRQLILFSEATRSCGLDSLIYGFVLLTYWLKFSAQQWHQLGWLKFTWVPIPQNGITLKNWKVLFSPFPLMLHGNVKLRDLCRPNRFCCLNSAGLRYPRLQQLNKFVSSDRACSFGRL